jgi:hypothetical protein
VWDGCGRLRWGSNWRRGRDGWHRHRRRSGLLSRARKQSQETDRDDSGGESRPARHHPSRLRGSSVGPGGCDGSVDRRRKAGHGFASEGHQPPPRRGDVRRRRRRRRGGLDHERIPFAEEVGDRNAQVGHVARSDGSRWRGEPREAGGEVFAIPAERTGRHCTGERGGQCRLIHRVPDVIERTLKLRERELLHARGIEALRCFRARRIRPPEDSLLRRHHSTENHERQNQVASGRHMRFGGREIQRRAGSSQEARHVSTRKMRLSQRDTLRRESRSGKKKFYRFSIAAIRCGYSGPM